MGTAIYLLTILFYLDLYLVKRHINQSTKLKNINFQIRPVESDCTIVNPKLDLTIHRRSMDQIEKYILTRKELSQIVIKLNVPHQR